jgi:hypothetical protein
VKSASLTRPPYETGRIWVPLTTQWGEPMKVFAGFNVTGAEQFHGRTLWRELAKPAEPDA